jgi:cytochrome b6-f complex iron-sulfur subunit
MSTRLEPDPIPRRDFLGIASMCSAAVAILGSAIGMARLAKPSVLPEASLRFRIGKASDFKPGTVKTITEHNVRIVCGNEGVAAMSLICTHLGCVVDKKEDGFKCPCHGSVFDEIGNIVAGPAPRGLQWLSVSRAADGSLIVDKGNEVPEGQFFEIA